MFDNLSKLFYPHYPSHHNSIHYEQPRRPRIHPRSKSQSTLEPSLQIDTSRLLVEENEHARIVEAKRPANYERRMKRFYSNVKSPLVEQYKPLEEVLIGRITPKLTARLRKRSELSASNKKQKQQHSLRRVKEEALMAALTVEKPKVETVENRIRTIVQDIFPLTSEIALGQFIERFDQLRSLLKSTKDEEKRMDKIAKSEKYSDARKLDLLKDKKRKFESELESEYESMFRQYFQPPEGTTRQAEELFRKKLRKHLRSLSKNLMLDKN